MSWKVFDQSGKTEDYLRIDGESVGQVWLSAGIFRQLEYNLCGDRNKARRWKETKELNRI